LYKSTSDFVSPIFGFDCPPPRGSTSLLFAIYADVASVPLLSMLVEAGADPHKTDEDGVGALHVAAIKVRFSHSQIQRFTQLR
jgi:ankyrin repeat protein